MGYKLEDVKMLRELMGAGIKDCKDALNASDGDIEKAKKYLRESGIAKAEKKSTRAASNGSVFVYISSDKKTAALLEVNCETDFVARSEPFNAFLAEVAKAAIAADVADLDSLLQVKTENHKTVEDARSATVLQVAENVQIKKIQVFKAETGYLAGYQHGQSIAVVLETGQEDDELAKNIAMHIAAINPISISENDIPEAVLADEKAIYVAQLKDSDKPEPILQKIIDGKLRKFASGLCLYGQAYVKDPKQTVKEYCNSKGANEVLQFARYALGE